MKIFKPFIVLYIIFIAFFSINKSYSDTIKDFKITGNERLAKETIVLFSELNIGDEVDQNIINLSFKKLFATNYFKNLKVNLNNGIVFIEVLENPIIQKIQINGVKNNSLLEELKKITKQSEKYPFIETNILEQKNLLTNIVRSDGFYFAKIETKYTETSNNSINIIYNINLGERAAIKKIDFIGNKVFKNNKLRNIIISEETKPWKFLTRNKFIDENRVKLDINLLRNYYKNRGYYNVKIKSSFAKALNNNEFNLIFSIDSGKKYFFNDINLILSDDYNTDSFQDLSDVFVDLKNETYSLNSIKKIMKEIDKIALQKEFVFINAKYNEKIIDNDKINIEIYFDEIDKSYIDRVNVFGNFITEEKVIRNSLIVDEGDAYNDILFNKSINDLKAKNIFKSVKSKIRKSKINKENKIIDIFIEEKPTGEIFAGAGTGTSGSSITAGIKERNYLGKGIKLDSNFTISDDELKGKFSVSNPNFRNTDRSLNTTIESTTTDFMTSSGYKTSRTGLSFGTGFEQYEDLFINFDISNYYENLETSDKASDIKKRQEGDYFENLFSYSLTMNKLDQNFQPTDGYRTSFTQTIPLISDDKAVENSFNAAKYYSINDNLILSAKLFLKAVNSLDDNVRVSKRVYIPSSKLKGFESKSIGPKDGTQYIGGNYGSALNLNTTLPNLLNDFENIDFSLFLDAANLWHVDYDSSLDSNKIRSATGLAVNWFTPIGPLTFSYAVPLSDASTDKTESFRFQIGTSF
tara:strand:- start:419 stop:2668 length:2250 start_codon:yes stop_codon:yes gene_type:complete